MKRLATIILISLSINYAILITSILIFHDKRSIYDSIRVGDAAPTAYPALLRASLTVIQLPRARTLPRADQRIFGTSTAL